MSDMSYTDTQLRAAAWSNKVTAAISFFSSSYLMYDILKDRGLICCCKRRQQSDTTPKLLTTMQKILLGMCLLDLIADIWFFVGGWAMPNDGETLYSGVATLSPRGTTASCTAQGFFLMLGLAIPLYQVSLTSFYYLTVCKNWKEDRQFRRYQPLFHIPPWCWGLGCALYGAIDDQFHPNLVWCFYGGTDISTELLFGLFYAPLWLSFLISGILLLLIWKKVREQEARIAKYTFVKRISMRITGKQNNDTENNGNTNNRQVVTSTERKYSQQILFQALFYAGSMIITFIFPTAMRLYQVTNPDVLPPFALFYLTAMFLPSQGFWNLIVYKRHTIQKMFSNLSCQCKRSPQRENTSPVETLSTDGDGIKDGVEITTDKDIQP